MKGTTRKVGPGDAYRAGTATVGGIPVEVGFFVFEFMGGSMGSVVGEKIARQFERAVAHRRPAIMFSASGGARMQEGVLSLMQMAKTSAARSRLREAKVPYIAVLLHPTTGGVAASVAMLGDVIIAEPDALIGFAGPRVIEQTIRQQLPPGFQRSEFLLEHGMVDLVVSRKDLKATLERTLRWFERGREPDASHRHHRATTPSCPRPTDAVGRSRTTDLRRACSRACSPRAGSAWCSGSSACARCSIGSVRPDRRLGAVVHVGGTNGKGSTVAMIAALARRGRRSASRRTPRRTCRRLRERIVIDGVADRRGRDRARGRAASRRPAATS